MPHWLTTPDAHFVIGKLGLVLLSAVLGAIIGYERERHERPAGLRTHMLVCIGSTLITAMDVKSGSRIAAQIVTGVGFLGAGTIMRDTTGGVRGLTTAASVWATAGIGIAVGLGFPYAWVAIGTTLLGLFILTGIVHVETIMNRHRRRQQLNLVIETGKEPLHDLKTVLHAVRSSGAETHNLEFGDVAGGQTVTVFLALKNKTTRDDIERCLQGLPQVMNYEWND